MDLNQQRINVLKDIIKTARETLDGENWTGNYWQILHLRFDTDEYSIAWSIHKKRSSGAAAKDENFYARRVIWNHAALKEHFQSDNPDDWDTSPPLDTHEVVLDAEKIYSILAKGKQLLVPVIGLTFYDVLDGTNHSLRFGKGDDGSVSLKWSSGTVAEWQPLEDWFDEVTVYLSEVLAHNETD